MSSTHVCTMFLIERITIALLFSSFLRLVCSLKIGLTFLQLLQHCHQMNPFCLFTFYWYQCALCVSRSRPATVYWYQPLVPETGQCDICFSYKPGGRLSLLSNKSALRCRVFSSVPNYTAW